MHARRLLFLLCVLSGFGPATAGADPFDDLAREVWAWRAATQPSSGDDIPRIDRPAAWLPDWSPAAVAARRTALADFTRRHQAMATTGWPVARQVDYRLIGSLLARVRWELDGAPAWRRDPAFYIQQALGPVFDVLLPFLMLDNDPPSHKEIAQKLSSSETATRILIHRLRTKFRDLLREEVARTVLTPQEIPGELAWLQSVLAEK